MKTKSILGVADPITLGVLVVLGICGVIFSSNMKKALQPQKPKQEVVKIDDKAEKAKVEAERAAKLAEDARIKTHQALDAEKSRQNKAAEFAAGASMALGSDKNPSIQSRVAKVMVDNVTKTLDPVSEAQLAEMRTIIKDLIERNDVTSAKLAQKEVEANLAKKEAEVFREQALEAGKRSQIASAEVLKLNTELESKTSKLREWADDNISLAARLKAIIISCSILVAILAFVYYKMFGWKRLSQDLTAVGEFTKDSLYNELQKHIPKERADEVIKSHKQNIKAWWRDSDSANADSVKPTKAEKQIEKIKSKVLRR